jgi:hypothetical protein
MLKPSVARCLALAVLTQRLSGLNVPTETKDSAGRFDGLALVRFDRLHLSEVLSLFRSPPLFAEDVEGLGVATVAALTAAELAAIGHVTNFTLITSDFGATLRASGMPKNKWRRNSGSDTVCAFARLDFA